MAVQSLKFSDIKNACLNMTNIAESLDATITAVKGAIEKITYPTWDGDASDNYQSELTKLENNLPDAKQQLALSVLFLTSCCNGYEELGKDNVNKLKELVGGQDYIDNFDVNSAPTPNLNSRYGIDSQDTTTDTTNTDTAADVIADGDGYSGGGGGGGGGGSDSTEPTTSPDESLLSGLGALGLIGEEVVALTQTTGTIEDLTTTEDTGTDLTLPDDVIQGGYGAMGYDFDLKTGQEVTYAEDSNEKKVKDLWKEQGSVFKNGIAVINVKGEDRYLVSVSSKYGAVGDCIDIALEDGTKVKCIIAGHSTTEDWGTNDPSGKVNILNLLVQKETYDKFNAAPTTAKWGLEWNSNFKVANVDNMGSIIGATNVPKGTLTGADTTSNSGSVVAGNTNGSDLLATATADSGTKKTEGSDDTTDSTNTDTTKDGNSVATDSDSTVSDVATTDMVENSGDNPTIESPYENAQSTDTIPSASDAGTISTEENIIVNLDEENPSL